MNKDIVIVSGGANGLGLSLTKKLINQGYYVCVIDQDKEASNELKNTYIDKVYVYNGDISDEEFIINTVNDINKKGNIIGLINNAGEPSFKLPKDYVKKDIDTCFKGLYGMIMLTGNLLKIKEENIRIANVMSSAALRGNKGESVYCATKWGEKGYTESLKVAYKGTSVKVIGVYPGGINTNFYKNSRDYVSLEKQHTFMNPDDVAEVIISNVFNNINLTVSDIIIERNQSN